MPAGEFQPLADYRTAGRPGASRTCQAPPELRVPRPKPSAVSDSPLRFEFADLPGSAPVQCKTDLEMVEDLLDRCWREVGASELNAKMADIVRLLEFKNKLRATAEAERTFWALIDHIRQEELSDFGLLALPASPIAVEDASSLGDQP